MGNWALGFLGFEALFILLGVGGRDLGVEGFLIDF